MRDLGCGEELSGAVRARGNTGTAPDAGGGVHGGVGGLLGYRYEVGVGRTSGGDGDESARLDDAVEGAAIDHQVPDDGEAGRSPWLDGDDVAVLELAHVELTGGGAALRAVGDAVDHEAAGAADPLPAIVVELDGNLVILDEAFVDGVEHFEERHVGADVRSVVHLEPTGLGVAFLAPDLQGDVHL